MSYTLVAPTADPTGTVINAQATVIFDTEPPLSTAPIFNTVDAGTGLTSDVAPLPSTEPTTQFTVAWSGTDSASGSAIASFNIDVSDNGGPMVPWLVDTTLNSALYTGVSGHTYAFTSQAADNAGNVEPMHASADATTLVTAPAPLAGN